MNGELFFESVAEVLDHTIKALGGYKFVGAALRGDKAPDQAAQWLRDCLNPEKREKLDPDQLFVLVRMGREKGVHAYMQYLSAELRYAPPKALSDDEKREADAAVLVTAMQQVAQIFNGLRAQGVDVSAFTGGATK